jgi:hypothetical protein
MDEYIDDIMVDIEKLVWAVEPTGGMNPPKHVEPDLKKIREHIEEVINSISN